MGIENMSNEQMKEVIKKVQKLLALAQSDNENEARLALQKAQELQAKYNIVFDQLDIEDESQKVIEEKYDAPDTESLNSLFTMMACNLADHYRVKTYINVHREWGTVDGKYQRTTKKQLVVVGLPFDVEVFKQSLFFAYNAMRKLATTFVRQLPSFYTRSQKLLSKNDYCFGFIKGCVKGLEENEMTKALIVVTPHVVIEHMNSMKLGAAAPMARASRGDYDAFEAGHRDGKDSMKGGSKRLTE